MVQFLALQVRLGRITMERVPARYRAAVERMMGND